MKGFVLIVLTFALFNCSNDDDSSYNSDEQQNIPEATILGRWVFQGFENTIRYEFTDTKRFTLYSDNGTFPTLEEFNDQNPELLGHDWYFEDEMLVVDLNFGNYSRLKPEFICDNYVVKWIDENGDEAGMYYKEGFDISACTEAQ